MNLLVIHPGPLRYDYLTPGGHPFLETKHLARLAEMGTWFERAYAASPLAAPSRTSALTGQYPQEHQIRSGQSSSQVDASDLAKAAADAGRVWIHIGPPEAHGDAATVGHASPGDGPSELAALGLDALARLASEDQPFCLALDLADSDLGLSCPNDDPSLFTAAHFDLPSNFRRERTKREPERLSRQRGEDGITPMPDEEFRQMMCRYADWVRLVDDQIGRLLDGLESLDLLADTVVFFCADTGALVGDFGVVPTPPVFYESLLRVPAAVWDPSQRLPREAVSDLVEVMDLYAAVRDLVGLPQPPHSRARNLLDPDHVPRRDIYAEAGTYARPDTEARLVAESVTDESSRQAGPGAVLRTRDWKLSLYAHDRGELFDIFRDPHECNNVYDDPGYARLREQMTARLLQRQMCRGQAPEDLPVTEP